MNKYRVCDELYVNSRSPTCEFNYRLFIQLLKTLSDEYHDRIHLRRENRDSGTGLKDIKYLQTEDFEKMESGSQMARKEGVSGARFTITEGESNDQDVRGI